MPGYLVVIISVRKGRLVLMSYLMKAIVFSMAHILNVGKLRVHDQ